MSTPFAPSPPHSTLSPDLERELRELFQSALDQKVFSGASLAVARSDRIVLTHCWGVTHDGGASLDKHTHFDLASLTKPLVTASLCIWAVSSGRLDLDSRLGQILPPNLTSRPDARGLNPAPAQSFLGTAPLLALLHQSHWDPPN